MFPNQIDYLIPCSNNDIQNTAKESEKNNSQIGILVSPITTRRTTKLWVMICVSPDQHLSFISPSIPTNFSRAFLKATTIK